MKKLFFVFGIIFCINATAQQYLQRNDTIIKLSGFDLITNQIRYDKITPLDTVGVIESMSDIWEAINSNAFSISTQIFVICNDAIIARLKGTKYNNWVVKL